MKKKLLLFGVALVVLLAPSVSSAQKIVASATGSGQLTVFGQMRVFAFTAQKDSAGNTTGNMHIVNMLSGAISDSKVNCLSVVGNVATMSGTISHANFEGSFDVWFRVADNGEGANAPPDQITLVLLSDPPGPSCSEDLNLGLRNIEEGNIQVH